VPVLFEQGIEDVLSGPTQSLLNFAHGSDNAGKDTGLQLSDLGHLGKVLVAARKIEEQVRSGTQTQTLKESSQRSTNPGEAVDRR
jgi:hypothetical protein